MLNDFIMYYNSLLETVKVEINWADFMLILSDETTVAINKSQLSTFIRYVNHKGEPQDGFFFFSYVSADRVCWTLI